MGSNAATIKSAFLDEAALLDRLSTELQKATRERDDAQGRAEELTRQVSEVQSLHTEEEMRLKEWKETSRDEHQRVRQEMMALSEQLQDLAMENNNLRGERESLIHTLSDARRAQSDAEECVGRLEDHMREMEEEITRDREAENQGNDLSRQELLDAQDRVLQLESERLILMQTVEASKKRVRDTELQRDALLPQLRSLTEDLRRVQELGLETKLRDSLVRISDAEYQQSLLDLQVKALERELAEARAAPTPGAHGDDGEHAGSWEAKCRELMSKLAISETEGARREEQIQQLQHRLEGARKQLQVAERQTKEWQVRSAQRDKESAWLRQNLRKMASSQQASTASDVTASVVTASGVSRSLVTSASSQKRGGSRGGAVVAGGSGRPLFSSGGPLERFPQDKGGM